MYAHTACIDCAVSVSPQEAYLVEGGSICTQCHTHREVEGLMDRAVGLDEKPGTGSPILNFLCEFFDFLSSNYLGQSTWLRRSLNAEHRRKRLDEQAAELEKNDFSKW